MSNKERITEINLLRALAIIAVVAQHALGFFVTQPEISRTEAIALGLFFNLMKFAVPAFIFATGMVLFYNYDRLTSYSAFMSKRIREVLVPYLFWSGIYFIYYRKITTLNVASMQTALKDLLTGTAGYHLWFVVMIFQFYLLYPVFLKIFTWIRQSLQMLTNQAKQNLGIALGIVVIAAYTGLMWFSSSYLPRYYHNNWPTPIHLFLVEYRDRSFLYWSFYFIWGGVGGIALARWRQFVDQTKVWWSIIFVALFTLVSYQLMQSLQGNLINLGYATSFKPSMFYYTVAQLILIYALSRFLASKAGLIRSILLSVGKYSFGLYLCHALVLNTVILTIKPWLLQVNFLTGAVLVTALTSAFSYLITVVLSKLPLSWLTVGTIRRQ